MNRKIAVFFLLGVLMLACGGTVATPDVGSIYTQAAQTAIAGMSQPIVTALPSPTPLATSSPPVSLQGNIPGIAFVDATLNLEPRGFTCGDPVSSQQSDGPHYLWMCNYSQNDITASVEIYGRNVDIIDTIEATVVIFQPNPDVPKAMLSYVATIPFVNQTEFQQPAKDWVASSLDQLGENGSLETTINGIHFKLWGSPLNRTLTIGRD